MTSRDFCYWLQGYFELSDGDTISGGRLEAVKRHLALVFMHEIDPSMGPEKHQAALDEIHNQSPVSWPPPKQDGSLKYRC